MLGAAVERGDPITTARLLQQGADVDTKCPNPQDLKKSWPALLRACYLGHAEVVRLLERAVDLGSTPAVSPVSPPAASIVATSEAHDDSDVSVASDDGTLGEAWGADTLVAVYEVSCGFHQVRYEAGEDPDEKLRRAMVGRRPDAEIEAIIAARRCKPGETSGRD